MTRLFDDTFTGSAVALPSHAPESGTWASLSGAWGGNVQTDGAGQIAGSTGAAGAYAQPGVGAIPSSGEYRVRGFVVKQTDLAGTFAEIAARGSWLSTNAAAKTHYYARWNATGDGATGVWELGVCSAGGSYTVLDTVADDAFAAAATGTVRVIDLEVRASAPLQRLIVSSWDGTTVDGNGDPVLTGIGEVTGSNTLAALSSGGNGFPGFPAVVTRTASTPTTGYHLTRYQVNDDLEPLTGAPTVTTAATISAAHSPAFPGDTLTVTTNTVYNDQGSAIDDYERKAQVSSDGGTTWTDITGTDGIAAAQADLPTYTAASGDAGDELRYASRAHNTVGWSVWSYSNAISVSALPAPPANTAKPTITGLAYTGQTLTYVPGTWTGSPTLSHTWQVDGVDAQTGGATFGPLPSGDQGHAVTIHETATNSGGSVTADSDPVTPQAVPDVTLDFYLTGGSGNTDPAASLGGAKSTAALTSPESLEAIRGSESRDGVTDYHWLVVHNPNPVVTADVVLWISANTTSPDTTAAIALLSTGIGQPPATLATDVTVPTDAGSFSAPADAGTGLDAGSFAPDQWRAFCVRWTVNAGAGPMPADTPDTLVIGWQATAQ